MGALRLHELVIGRTISLDAHKGFTLVELMVAMVLSGLAMVGVYRGFVSFVAATEVQEQMVELNQGAQVAMTIMTDDLRMAGYDPTSKALASFLASSTSTNCDFNMDLDGDESIDTTISYRVVNGDLQRVLNGTARPLISNVESLNFVYLDAATPPNVINIAGGGDPGLVRQVQVALVIRTTNEDYSYTDTRNYLNLQATEILAVQNDNFHRQLATMIVRCRNMQAS